jgi:hypothetical protein
MTEDESPVESRNPSKNLLYFSDKNIFGMKSRASEKIARGMSRNSAPSEFWAPG